MWALLWFALLATAAASPASQVLTYHYRMQSTRNDMMTNQLTSKVEDQFKKRCQRYADNEAFNNFISVRANVIQEIQSAAMTEATKAIEEAEQPKPLQIFCKLSPTIKSSITKMITAIKPCMKPENREELGYVQNVTDSFMDYVCYNDGERVTTFVLNEGIECVTERQMGLSQCVESAVSEEEKENQIDNDIFGSDESMDKEAKEKKMAEDCREITELETCIKKELDQCSSKTTSTFVTGLMDSIFNPVCEKYTRN